MRRILVDNARRKLAVKGGGNENFESVEILDIPTKTWPHEVIAVHEGLDALAIEDQLAADIVKLHYFAGFSIEEAAKATGISRASAYRLWNASINRAVQNRNPEDLKWIPAPAFARAGNSRE